MREGKEKCKDFFLFDLKKDKKTFLKISILKGKQIVRHAESAQAMRFMTEAFDAGGFLEQGPLPRLHECVLRLEK